MQTVDALQVVQLAYAPELNPVECFFQELRRAVEGRVYPTRQAKQAAMAASPCKRCGKTCKRLMQWRELRPQ